jgi:hypothetical protein
MHSSTKSFPVWAFASVAVIGAVAALSSQVSTSSASGPAAAATHAVGAAAVRTVTAAAAVAAVTPATPPAIRLAAPVANAAVKFASEEAVRAQLKFESVKYAGKRIDTLEEESRILLVQAAAERAGLQKVGLSFHDVYGVIEAETSWIPRTGLGKNGVVSYGLAQFEPRTAKGLGLRNPNDPVQAVYAAAINIKHGAKWAEEKIAHLQLTPEQRAEKIREGVSIYYNLSVKGRNKWDGLNTAQLPIETQRHIRNVRAGSNEAVALAEALDT